MNEIILFVVYIVVGFFFSVMHILDIKTKEEVSFIDYIVSFVLLLGGYFSIFIYLLLIPCLSSNFNNIILIPRRKKQWYKVKVKY